MSSNEFISFPSVNCPGSMSLNNVAMTSIWVCTRAELATKYERHNLFEAVIWCQLNYASDKLLWPGLTQPGSASAASDLEPCCYFIMQYRVLLLYNVIQSVVTL